MTAVLDHDAGHRVIQCACNRTRAWIDREDAVVAGWGSRWEGDARVWFCPDCFVPPVAPPAEPPSLTPPERVMFFALGTAREQEQLRGELARMLEVDPERGRAWASHVVERAGEGKSDRAKKWRAWGREHLRAQKKTRKKTTGEQGATG